MSRADAVGKARALGIMTGTSADAADVALVTVDRGGPRRATRLVAFRSRPFSPALREGVLEAQEGRLGTRPLLALHAELGRHAALAARQALDAPEARGFAPDVAGFHGQTIFHDPHGALSGVPLSAQIGDPCAVAQAVGCPVVSNFRMADVLEGGEGAPLVPRFDHHQFASERLDRTLLNLGGIANLTRLRPGVGVSGLVAFDCGPGNMLLDGIVAAIGSAGARYDPEGALAASGHVADDVVREILGEPFFSRSPPKSAGREEFGAAFLRRFLDRTEGRSLADRLRTAVAITAESVARGIAMSGADAPDQVLVSGGGTRNRTLLQAIQAALPRSTVETTAAHGVPVEAKEAMAFAFLAFETISGRPGNAPAATGARREVVLGSITPAPVPR